MEPEPDLVTVVKTATHRLRTISTAVERLRGAAAIHRSRLEELRRAAPDIDISDVPG